MDEIKASPTLDSLVAERVNGWKRGSPMAGYAYDQRGDVVNIPAYSTNRGAAIRLLDEDKECLSLVRNVVTRAWACVDLDTDDPYGKAFWFPSLALAIVVGVLEANGVNVRAELAKGGGGK